MSDNFDDVLHITISALTYIAALLVLFFAAKIYVSASDVTAKNVSEKTSITQKNDDRISLNSDEVTVNEEQVFLSILDTQLETEVYINSTVVDKELRYNAATGNEQAILELRELIESEGCDEYEREYQYGYHDKSDDCNYEEQGHYYVCADCGTQVDRLTNTIYIKDGDYLDVLIFEGV